VLLVEPRGPGNINDRNKNKHEHVCNDLILVIIKQNLLLPLSVPRGPTRSSRRIGNVNCKTRDLEQAKTTCNLERNC
jgi:hypothetical protein